MLGRSYLPNDQPFWSIDPFVKDTCWWSWQHQRGGKGEHYKVGNTRHAREAMSDTAAHLWEPFSPPWYFCRKTDAFLGIWPLLAVTEIFSSWCSSPRAVKTNPWTPHQCACQTTAGASTSLHSCDDQCHNTMCMPGLVYAAPNWSMQGNKASSMNKVMGSRFGRFLWVMNTINTNCRTVCFSYHKYCE